ncbi:ParB N-terminal domain-containing protein [Paenibacillus sp. L3-i20]|uniref:ParB N-terminal domain-containing protein n=1 Tax=Paenibacillus sp. L3-i20 TaxID=2905833 RepID=UPI001EDEAA01|nr:ParB N-terminal domain-containing protein [Paenibacillus sp. L3-i20]GKU79875.1 hypothetical protein L3i20_v242720 [Paenibacillus sp. L3-i20]
MEIRTINISMINAATYNPRVDLQPGDPEYEKLKRSIETFGYVEPIVWNERTGNMVGGHQRFKIMVNESGNTELDVSVVDLDDEKEKLLNITLNKVTGRWDDESLARLLDELQSNGADVELTGYDGSEINRLLADFTEPIDDQLGDFKNRELSISEFDEENFDCKCPRCGFVFDSEVDA